MSGVRVLDAVHYLKSAVPFTYHPLAFPPTDTGDCAAVSVTGGGSPDTQLSRPAMQVLIRAAKPATAEAKAWEIFNQLHMKRGFSMGESRIVLCSAQQSSPLYVGQDANGRFLFSVNFSLLAEVQ